MRYIYDFVEIYLLYVISTFTLYHISQGEDVRHSMTTNIIVASPTFIRLVLGIADDFEMPHFTPFTLASCLFNLESFVANFVEMSESIPC